MANEVRIRVTADTAKAEQQLKGFSGSVNRASDKLRNMRGPLLAVTGAMAGLGVLGVKATSDLNESLNAAQVTFGESASIVEEFGKTSADAFGISNRAALEHASTLGAVFTASGLVGDASANMSVRMLQLAADLASVRNIKLEEALTRINSGLVGEVEPLRRVGILLNAASVEAKAMELGLADSNGELSEGAKIQARYAIILEQTEGITGDFANTSEGLANSLRRVESNAEDAAAKLGENLAPAIENVTKLMNDALLAFAEAPSGFQNATVAAGGFLFSITALGLIIPPFITGLGALKGALGAVAGPWGLVAIGIAAVVAAWMKLGDVIESGGKQAVANMTEGMDALNMELQETAQLANTADAEFEFLMTQSAGMTDVLNDLAFALEFTKEGMELLTPPVKETEEELAKFNATLDGTVEGFIEATRAAMIFADELAHSVEPLSMVEKAHREMRRQMIETVETYDVLGDASEGSSDRQVRAIGRVVEATARMTQQQLAAAGVFSGSSRVGAVQPEGPTMEERISQSEQAVQQAYGPLIDAIVREMQETPEALRDAPEQRALNKRLHALMTEQAQAEKLAREAGRFEGGEALTAGGYAVAAAAAGMSTEAFIAKELAEFRAEKRERPSERRERLGIWGPPGASGFSNRVLVERGPMTEFGSGRISDPRAYSIVINLDGNAIAGYFGQNVVVEEQVASQ
jgi:hypothetical protein